MSAENYRLDIVEVQRFLPHRAPFLLIDRVLEIHPTSEIGSMVPANMIGTRVVAQKNVSVNEPFFQGHFPKFPIMPGVLIIETMAQASAFSIYPHVRHDLDRFAQGFECILVGVDGVRFRKPVVPGDSVRFETVVTRSRGKLWTFDAKAFVDGQKVAEAEIMANLNSPYFAAENPGSVPGGLPRGGQGTNAGAAGASAMPAHPH